MRRTTVTQVTSYYQESANTAMTPLLQKLDLTGEHKTKFEPYFTGWKEFPYNPNGEAVGQLVQWIPKKDGNPQRAAYVNLPGMEKGIVEEGACFDIGDKRINILNPPTLLETEAMLIQGLSILKELVKDQS